MAGDPKQLEQPIIVKRIKKGHGGHHGGSWKVAFADFATAMMAFFMLLWILGQSTKEQKAAVSQYFNNPSAVNLGGSSGLSGMESGMPGGENDGGNEGEAGELGRLENLERQIEDAIEEQPALQPFKDQILVEMTSEGVRIQIIDKEIQSMFASGSSRLEPSSAALLQELARVIATVPNRISISGHTDARPFGSPTYTNWELSADRANAARRELLRGGLDPTKMGRVVGLASHALLVPEHPEDPRNRRITIVVMNKSTENAIQREGGILLGVQQN